MIILHNNMYTDKKYLTSIFLSLRKILNALEKN